jgi:CRP-like cAMP-binding protein
VVETSVSEGIENIFLRFPKIETVHRKNLERNIISLQKRILNQLQLTSLDRYKIFLKQYPEIEKYALNYHIASYLGITQQSLSRIRASYK